IDRTNNVRIRIRFRPRLISFTDRHSGFRKPVADLKGITDPGKLCIEVCGKTVGSNAEAALQAIVLSGADFANPPVLKNRQDGKENQEKTNQDKAGLRTYHHPEIIVRVWGGTVKSC